MHLVWASDTGALTLFPITLENNINTTICSVQIWIKCFVVGGPSAPGGVGVPFAAGGCPCQIMKAGAIGMAYLLLKLKILFSKNCGTNFKLLGQSILPFCQC